MNNQDSISITIKETNDLKNNTKTNDNNSIISEMTERKMSLEDEMFVVKRNGEKQNVSFDKILLRVQNLGKEANISIPYGNLVMKVIDQLYNGIETTEIELSQPIDCNFTFSLFSNITLQPSVSFLITPREEKPFSKKRFKYFGLTVNNNS